MTRQERAELIRNQAQARREAEQIAEKLRARTTDSVARLIAWKTAVNRENESRGLVTALDRLSDQPEPRSGREGE
jgi:hypothetical protein